MNWDQVEGNWKQFTGAVREKWGKLTDDDLAVIGGKREKLAGALQKQYGYAKEAAEKEIDTFLANSPKDMPRDQYDSHRTAKTGGH